MKKFIFAVISLLLLTCGCESMMNTPTKRVEEFLNKYQREDNEVLVQLDEVISNGNLEFTDEQMNSYKNIMKKQYKNLTYVIKEEMIDGDNATVTVEIEVFDYNRAMNDAENYYVTNPDELKNEKGEVDNYKYMDYRIKQLTETKEKVKYTLNLTLTKVNDKWILNDISQTDIQKIHGLYNS